MDRPDQENQSNGANDIENAKKCKICLKKENEDIALIFGILYNSLFEDNFIEANEDESISSNHSLVNNIFDKIKKLQNEINMSILYDIINTPLFSDLIKHIFKSKYNIDGIDECKHYEMYITFVKIFDLENIQNLGTNNEKKNELQRNNISEKLQKLLNILRNMENEIELVVEEINQMPKRIMSKIFKQKLSNKKVDFSNNKTEEFLEASTFSNNEQKKSSSSISTNCKTEIINKNSYNQSECGNTIANSSLLNSGIDTNSNLCNGSDETLSNVANNKFKLPKKATDMLKSWFLNNINHPYPNNHTKGMLCKITGLNKKQIQNWFTNSRKRFLEPLKRRLEKEENLNKMDHALDLENPKINLKNQNIQNYDLIQSNNENQENIASINLQNQLITKEENLIQPQIPIKPIQIAYPLQDNYVESINNSITINPNLATIPPINTYAISQDHQKLITPFNSNPTFLNKSGNDNNIASTALIGNSFMPLATKTPTNLTNLLTPQTQIYDLSSSLGAPIVYPSIYTPNVNGYVLIPNQFYIQPSCVLGYRQVPNSYPIVNYIPISTNNNNAIPSIPIDQSIYQSTPFLSTDIIEPNQTNSINNPRNILNQHSISTNYNTINNNIYNNINNLSPMQFNTKINASEQENNNVIDNNLNIKLTPNNINDSNVFIKDQIKTDFIRGGDNIGSLGNCISTYNINNGVLTYGNNLINGDYSLFANGFKSMNNSYIPEELKDTTISSELEGITKSSRNNTISGLSKQAIKPSTEGNSFLNPSNFKLKKKIQSKVLNDNNDHHKIINPKPDYGDIILGRKMVHLESSNTGNISECLIDEKKNKDSINTGNIKLP